jgi:hypothetical protein
MRFQITELRFLEVNPDSNADVHINPKPQLRVQGQCQQQEKIENEDL